MEKQSEKPIQGKAYGGLFAQGHETVSFFQDEDSGLVTIIAVHNTVLGPALGGCRMRPYASLDAALLEVLNLSEAMTYKNALCGINFGGGKSVILANNGLKGTERERLFFSFGRCVSSLSGKYITAEDMGTSVADMATVSRTSSYVAGRDTESGGGGDPSPYTALGVFEGMKACLTRVLGSDNIAGRHIAIQGAGHVGFELIKLLAAAGAKVTFTDLLAAAIERTQLETGATYIKPDAITAVECDIFAPCATGGSIDNQSARTLKCRIVAGAANNQIADEKAERVLVERGILYAPDFAINAGGVILCADEFEPGGFNRRRVTSRVLWIRETVGMIIDQAGQTGELPGEVAKRLAKERIDNAKSIQATHAKWSKRQ